MNELPNPWDSKTELLFNTVLDSWKVLHRFEQNNALEEAQEMLTIPITKEELIEAYAETGQTLTDAEIQQKLDEDAHLCEEDSEFQLTIIAEGEMYDEVLKSVCAHLKETRMRMGSIVDLQLTHLASEPAIYSSLNRLQAHKAKDQLMHELFQQFVQEARRQLSDSLRMESGDFTEAKPISITELPATETQDLSGMMELAFDRVDAQVQRLISGSDWSFIET
ncbi:MAG: hypothetical protein JWM56_802 [Candidatus Peribacteria bacterium]|nr:hypothetical protein [Candidatus Peribacteria bacterium]